MGADHPIAWCRIYEGARIWSSSLGHFSAAYTENGGDNTGVQLRMRHGSLPAPQRTARRNTFAARRSSMDGRHSLTRFFAGTVFSGKESSRSSVVVDVPELAPRVVAVPHMKNRAVLQTRSVDVEASAVREVDQLKPTADAVIAAG